MRLFLILFFVFTQSARRQINMPPEATSLSQPDEKVYAFVGRIVSAEKNMVLNTVTETVVENGIKRELERQVASGIGERMIATYEIIHSINGDLQTDRITFTAYDHFGFFNFADYEHALLLVGKHDGKYFLHKYQHDTVFETVNGRWASCGESPIDTAIYNIPQSKAETIEFSSNVRFGPNTAPPISRGLISETKALEDYWNSPIFEIVGDSAICKKGIYAEDLFDLRMKTVMKARAKYDD